MFDLALGLIGGSILGNFLGSRKKKSENRVNEQIKLIQQEEVKRRQGMVDASTALASIVGVGRRRATGSQL